MPLLHDNPTDCPGNLNFHFDDAGSRQYWQDVLRKERNPTVAGDCSIIAAALALEQRYDETVSDLKSLTMRIKPNRLHFRREIRKGRPGTLLRGMKHLHPKRSDPLYGTYSEVLDHYLTWEKAHFAMVYGEDSGNIQRCVCDPNATFIVDGIVQGRGDHSSAIIDGVIYGEIDIGDEDFQVIHVWKMNPSVKEYRRQRKIEVKNLLEKTERLLEETAQKFSEE